MKRRILIAVSAGFLWVLCGCNHPRSVVGDWTENDPQAKMFLELKADNSFGLVAGNDFAAGAAFGKYDATGNKITLHVTGGTEPTWTYRWVGADEIILTSDVEPGKEYHLKRVSRAANSLANPGSAATIAGASDQALSTTCLSNLKQMSTAALMYAQDYDGTFCDANQWQQKLMPYTKSDKVFSCPALMKQGKQGGYAMNSSLSGESQKSVTSPQTMPLFFEVAEGAPLSADPTSDQLKVSRHNGTIAFVFTDGHGEGAHK